jgi:hypothetical protein
MSSRLRISLMLILLGMLASVPVFAGSAVVGSVAGTMNASIGGQALLPNTTIFSGDSLQVKDGAAVVALDNGNRVSLGKDTVASFERNDNTVTVVLTEGGVSLFNPDSKTALKIRAGGVTVEPAPGFKTMGEVAMMNGTILVTAKDGTLQVVNQNGKTVEVAKGKTIALTPKNQRAPQTGGSQKLGGGAPAWVDYTIFGIAVGALIAAIVAWSDAKGARSNAALAISHADAAGSNAVSAVASAYAGISSSISATQAALTAAIIVNHAETVNVGCALNTFANAVSVPSPYTPLVGSCPAGIATPL